MVYAVFGTFDGQDLIQSFFGKKKGIEFDISFKDEEGRDEYNLALLNGQSFTFPIYGVGIG